MSVVDPIELFRLCDPFADDGFTEADGARVREIVAAPFDEVARRRHRRRRPWVIGGAVILIAGATAAFAVLREEKAPVPTEIYCYPNDTLRPAIVIGPDSDPIAACRVWLTNDEYGLPADVQLVGCVDDRGRAAILPGDADTCEQLGWPDLDVGRTPEQQEILRLDAYFPEIDRTRCLDRQQAHELAEQALAGSTLEGWTIRDGDWPDGDSCAWIDVVPEYRWVMVGGGRRQPGQEIDGLP